MNTFSFLKKLNDRQREAVLEKEGPVLIVAGAGAGKTRTIVFRILHLIASGVNPRNIAAVTFTNKAAEELRERLHALMKESGIQSLPFSIGEGPFVGTFHSLGVFLLRNEWRAVGIQKNFSIADRNQSLSAVRDALKEEGFDPKQFDPGRILSTISRNKGELVTAEEYTERTGNEYYPGIVASVWSRYEKLMAGAHELDFDDLLLRPVNLLLEHKEIREEYQKKWRYIHIDEYQDTNKAQYMLSKLLAEKHRNICVVGDGDQNIYSWRGANIKNILHFEKDYPGAKIIFLEENYRSSATIVEAAHETIRKNTLRIEKKAFTNNERGEKISFFAGGDESGEALFVASKAKDLIERGTRSEDIAVLYRANFQSRILEETFLGLRVPYQVVGVRFFERKEVRDILSFVRAALDPTRRSDIKRIINIPPRGIGKVTLLKLFAGDREKLPYEMQTKIKKFYDFLKKIKKEGEVRPPSELIKLILEESGMKEYLSREGDEGKERLENIRELVTLATLYDRETPALGLQKLLENAALASDQDALLKGGNGVRLMTVHASKGLEFETVFVTGLEQGLFPHEYIEDERRGGVAERAEEERRLFYVALTRAAKKVFLSLAEQRTIFGKAQYTVPSEFLGDIPAHLLQYEEESARDNVNLPSIMLD